MWLYTCKAESHNIASKDKHLMMPSVCLKCPIIKTRTTKENDFSLILLRTYCSTHLYY